jgi:hypothetical protein
MRPLSLHGMYETNLPYRKFLTDLWVITTETAGHKLSAFIFKPDRKEFKVKTLRKIRVTYNKKESGFVYRQHHKFQ